MPPLLGHTDVHACGCATCILFLCVLGAPTAPDWLGAGSHRPEEVPCSGLAEHHLFFSLVLADGRVRTLLPLGLEPSIAKPSLL